MPRKPLIRSEHLPYHVTSRSHNKEAFALPIENVWSLALKSIAEAHAAHPVEVVSFVLMSNHYHLLLYTPKGNLDLFMYEFNKRLAQSIQRESKNINQVFGGRYKWNLIENKQYFSNCYRYVFQNPVRAGLVFRCEDYRYSTLACSYKNINFPIPIHDKFGFKDEFVLSWLNESLKEKDLLVLRKKLKRTQV
jgi:putative transposase